MATQRALTTKQARFVIYYVGRANGNATEAARLAGYKSPDQLGRRLVRKSTVRTAIDARLDAASLTANEILARLSDQASSSLDDFIRIDSPTSFSLDLQKAKRLGRLHCIKKIKHTEMGVEFELYDAQAALEKLGRYRGLWKDPLPADMTDVPTEELERIVGRKGGGSAGVKS